MASVKQATDGSFQPCSVCLEPVADGGGDRSIAKLKCGHSFHLDCIGSAFNAKGSMQCPNCRHVEDGQWLYANGCQGQDEFVSEPEDMFHDEAFDIYNGVPELISPHEETHFGHVQWCPYRSSNPHLSLSIEEVGHSPICYSDLIVNVLVREHTSSFNAAHPCPFIQAQGWSARHLVSPGGNVAARDMVSGSQQGSPVIVAGTIFRQVPVPHRRSWFRPNVTHLAASGGSVENGVNGQIGTLHPHDRSRWIQPDLDRFTRTVHFTHSRPSEAISGAIEMHGRLPYGQSHSVPGRVATIQPPLQFGVYATTGARSRRFRGRASSQMPHAHVAYSHGGLVVHGATNWGVHSAATGQETIMGGIEAGQMDRTSMAQWRRDDSHVIPLLALEPESQRWMQPSPSPPPPPLSPPQPSSASYQPNNVYNSELAMQGGIRMPEGSLVNQYQRNFPVFIPISSDTQTNSVSLHPSVYPPR